MTLYIDGEWVGTVYKYETLGAVILISFRRHNGLSETRAYRQCVFSTGAEESRVEENIEMLVESKNEITMEQEEKHA